ncbi:podocan-like isoform X2 [Oncorhynchus nerka]|uniref:podocan-like isoform X2 n=1 Tax=Oncorhynchus nerka TaxID=8023 RepID=UPI0031B8A289
MARTSLLQGLTVLLLAWALVHCQAPLEPQEEEEEDDPMEETEIENFLVPAVAKVEPVVCPGECSCTEEGAVDCAGVDLMDFPSELSESTRILSLQDNDPKQNSRLCKGYLTKKESDGVLHQMTWPPQSPDLNPIEMV